MSGTIDKPRLSRAHALELLKQMVRIRRFEEKCYELYTQEKIRGFLHLYDGEEAVAVGVIPVLEKRDRVVATYREHGQALVRGVPMTTALAEMYGKQEGCSGGRGGSMHLFDRSNQFLRRKCHRRRRIAARGRAGAGRSHARRGHRHRLLFRRWCRCRRRVPREPQSCGVVVVAGAVRVREQSLRHGDRACDCRIGNGHSSQGAELSDKLPRRSTAWTWSLSKRRRVAPCRRSGDQQAVFSRVPHLPVARPFHVRRPTLPRQGGSRGVAPERSRSCASADGSRRTT